MKKILIMSQVNTIAQCQGTINIDITLTYNYNICYIGQFLIKVFQTFLFFATSNNSFQFMLSSLLNCCSIMRNYVFVDLPLGLLNSSKAV